MHLLTHEVFQTCAIQHRARADNTGGGITGATQGVISEQIDGVGHDKQNRLAVIGDDAVDDAIENFKIAGKQVKTRLSRLLSRACGDDDQTRVREVGIVARVELHGCEKGQAVGDIESLALGFFAVGVDEHHLGKQTAFGVGVGDARPYEAASDDGAFLFVYHNILLVFSYCLFLYGRLYKKRKGASPSALIYAISFSAAARRTAAQSTSVAARTSSTVAKVGARRRLLSAGSFP